MYLILVYDVNEKWVAKAQSLPRLSALGTE